ncbi:MAG TPA: aminotransferase class I/II-fold pyridoxal phosphate-dependent enzyme [Smithellaceae bacterium]|nr:aminotransferase class I/II-fold pyridoxal phosphate-dependent enzyme [Geobacteraceae bacterium]HPL66324.1 aminotransferase class I/II-fold pyridoxal phosphate-dependent enzyme [Smithellaceae bacterium]
MKAQVPVKYRSHISEVWRTRPDGQTRLDKLRLDKNERISAFPPGFWESALKKISESLVQSYPEVYPLYKKLADFHGLTMEHFLLTAGSDAAIRHCFEAFVNPGDKVIYLEPTFAMVSVYGGLFGAEMIPMRYDAKLQIDFDLLLRSIDDGTALIIIANPNSPTGTYMSNDRLNEIAHRAAGYRIPVLVDEAYYGFCPKTALDILAQHENMVITRTFSKISGLAGLRIGYAMGHPGIISLLTKFRPMYEVNSPAVLMACEILDHWDIAADYGRRTIAGREKFIRFLRERGFTAIDTEANFLHVDLGRLKEPILVAMVEAGILVRGMLSIEGLGNYTRFSVGPWETMSRAADIIDEQVRLAGEPVCR